MHVLDDDDIMGNLFASFGYLNIEKLCFFGSKLPKVTWKLESYLEIRKLPTWFEFFILCKHFE